MPNPWDFLFNTGRRIGQGIGQGGRKIVDTIQQGGLDPTRPKVLPPDADMLKVETMADAADPATLDQVRRALPPTFNGTPNPVTQPRPIAPQDRYQSAGPTETRSIRPAMPNIPGGNPDQYAPRMPDVAPPAKTYGHQRLDYADQHGKRSAKEIALGALMGFGQGGLGGAIAGAAGSAIAPKTMAAMRFDAGPGRRFLQNQEMDRENELYDLKRRGMETQIDENLAQGERARRPTLHNTPQNNTTIDQTGRVVYQAPRTPSRPVTVAPGATVLDPETYEPRYTAPAKPGADTQRYRNVPAAGAVWDSETGRVVYQNPGKPQAEPKVTPAEERTRVKEITGEVSKHNELRAKVIRFGELIQKTQPDAPQYANLVATYNANKQQFEAESARLADTYGENIENVDSSGKWPTFKVRIKPTASARPAQPARNNDDAVLQGIRSNPEEYAKRARAKGATEEQIQKVFRMAGVQ